MYINILPGIHSWSWFPFVIHLCGFDVLFYGDLEGSVLVFLHCAGTGLCVESGGPLIGNVVPGEMEEMLRDDVALLMMAATRRRL